MTPLEEIAMERGEARGQLQAGRQAVLDAIEARFGAVPGEVAARVEQITDPERLRQVLRLAVTEPSIERFVAGLI